MGTRQKKARLYKRRDGKWSFTVKGGNGEKIATAQGYTRRFDARRALKRNHPGVVLVED